MGKFAFVIHPLDINLISIAFNESNLQYKKMSLLKKAFEWLAPFKCSEVTGLMSQTGKKESGYLIYCPLLPEQMISLNQKFVVRRVIEACKIAQELKAKIIGLGAYAANVGKKGVIVAKSLKIPVTTGTHYTIAVAIQGTVEVANRMGIRLEESRVSVIGATGGIGRICSEVLSEIAGELTLVARNKNKLEALASSLRNKSKAKVLTSDDLSKTVKLSDISIMSTTTPEPLIDVEDLEPGSLICDISRPRNVSMNNGKLKKGVLVIDGGIVRPPGNVKFNFYFGLPEGLGYACMAETMILALEEKHENYSLGGEVSLDKVQEVWRLGNVHGFKIAELRSFDEIIPLSAIEDAKESYHKKKKKL